MRIFTGIALDGEVRKGLLRELQPLQKSGAPILWTAERNLHLTLKFIGEASEGLTARIGSALQAASAIAPFRLRLSGFGRFPAAGGLRILWAGVEESQGLRALFAAIEDALAGLGIGRDLRPFHPHITLGRSADSRPNQPRQPSTRGGAAPSARGGSARGNFRSLFALLAEKSSVFLGEWTVGAFQLYSSRLAPGGPHYSVLKEIPLVQS